MDYGLLNALGITIMMVFGLWAYHQGYKKRHNKREESLNEKKQPAKKS